MLCQFSVRNYKSIRDKITLDMRFTAISEQECQLIRESDGAQYLPFLVLYGPNGSGKSNVLNAVQALANRIIRPVRAAENCLITSVAPPIISIKPFAFDARSINAPTEFEICFRTQTAGYRYILHIQNNIILFGNLDQIKLSTAEKQKTSLLRRENGRVVMKNNFAKLKVGDNLSDSLPVLSYLGIVYRKNGTVSDVIGWFKNQLQFANYGESILGLENLEKNRRFVLKILQEMELGVDDFRIEKEGKTVKEIYTKHTVDGRGVELRIRDESSGVQKLFALTPHIIDSLLEGNVLLVDEMDANIYPSLLRRTARRRLKSWQKTRRETLRW